MGHEVERQGKRSIGDRPPPIYLFPLLEAPAAFTITRGSIGMGRSPGTSAKV